MTTDQHGLDRIRERLDDLERDVADNRLRQLTPRFEDIDVSMARLERLARNADRRLTNLAGMVGGVVAGVLYANGYSLLAVGAAAFGVSLVDYLVTDRR